MLAAINSTLSDKTFTPKQAIAPTAKLYRELVADGMDNMAKTYLTQITPIPHGAMIHDNGCGVGAGTAAVVAAISDPSTKISIKVTDINEEALANNAYEAMTIPTPNRHKEAMKHDW